MPYLRVTPVIDPRVRNMCHLPYEGHPKGCPNFGSSPRCPPKAPTLYQVFREGGVFYAVYSAFPLAEHVASMRTKHPDWSERQLRCVLYWQGTARKRLKAEVVAFRGEHGDRDWLVETTPEAMGVNVHEMMRLAGLSLPWPPVDIAYHVALAGERRPVTAGAAVAEEETWD